MGPLILLYILPFIGAAIYLYVQFSYSYWKRRGVPFVAPKFPFGNVRRQLTREISLGDLFAEFYTEFKARGEKHGGVYMFLRPIYIPVDLNIIKSILQNDFAYFMNHGGYINEEADPLTGHLFNLEGEKWRNLRAKLTPTFTSGKMKMMFQTLVTCTDGLKDVLNDYAIIRDPVDIKDVASRFTTDIIGSCGFGIDCNSLKDPNSEFRQFGKKLFDPSFSRSLKHLFFSSVPTPIIKKLGLKLSSPDIEDFFMNVVKKTVEYREENNIQRKDFMHLLIVLKNKGQVSDDDDFVTTDTKKQVGQSLTINEVAAQCFVFFAAGFDTSATTMTFALLELALNPDIQEKLRRDIVSALEKHNGELTYEAVMDMVYLDKVVHETLRKHSPAPVIPRVCNKEYKVPGTDVTLEPETRVHIPIQAIQRDPDFYPDPEKFDPERFSEENKAKRPAITFLSFGEGPRACIGARFGLLQAKVGLIAIIKNFKVTLNKKTKTPIKYATKQFISVVDGDVWLDVTSI